MTRLMPQEAFELIGCRYDKGMAMVRTGELDGTYYRIGRRVFFIKEKLEQWIENRVLESAQDKKSIQHGLKLRRIGGI